MSWLNSLRGLLQRSLQGEESRHPADEERFDERPRNLTREDVLRLIEENGGPEGLDLSAFDLAGVDLRGLNLRGIVFGRGDFSGVAEGANLAAAAFSNSDLTRASLIHTDLQDASFWQATLYEATLYTARARNASFGKADLRRADLYACDLSGSNLWRARLEGANLAVARLADALTTEIKLGASLVQEHKEAYEEYFQRWYVDQLPIKYKERHLAARYQEASEIYMNLKNSFLSHGRYKEASWAYVKERQMRRATLAPWRARLYFSEEFARSQTIWSWRWWWLQFKYMLKWMLDWAADLLCGYGERPLRTVLWAGVVLLVFPLLYRVSNGVVSAAGAMSGLDYFNYSFGAFTTFGFDRFQAVTPLAQTLTSVEALLGISMLALLMFTLGNRISRS